MWYELCSLKKELKKGVVNKGSLRYYSDVVFCTTWWDSLLAAFHHQGEWKLLFIERALRD
jgi:hypothetical protein